MKNKLTLNLLLLLLPLFAVGQTADPSTGAAADSAAIKKQIRQDSLFIKWCQEVDFVIDKIENTYVCGRRGMSDDEWNRRVQIIYDKGRTSDLSTKEYYYALRYIGLLLNDGHFQFPRDGVYNYSRIFKEEDIIFPVRVKTWEDGSVYTVRDYTNTIPKDAEIIRVNGRLAKEMTLLNRLLAPEEDLYAMDCMNLYDEPDPRDWKNFTNFLFTEQIKPPYRVEYMRPGNNKTDTVTIHGMQREAIYKKYKKSGDKRAAMKAKGGDFFSKAIRYKKVDNKLGVLTINSFWGNNLIEILLFHKDWTYPRQLKRAMGRLYRNNVDNLIIDLSLNSGGMADNVYKTLNYFTEKPINAGTRYTVTDKNRKLTKIRAMNAIPKIFGISKEDKKRLGALIDSMPAGTTFMTDTLFKVQFVPNHPKHSYRGNVYVLTSNYTFSAGQIFAQYVKELNIGNVAGQPCGGYSVVTSGNTDSFQLPGYASFIPLEVPVTLEKKFIGINKYEHDTVDITIERPFDEWLSGESKSLNKLIEIIKAEQRN